MLRVVLASASPRRAELLRAIGLAPVVAPSGVDEDPLTGETPAAHVARLAARKGLTVRERLVAAGEPAALVLAADTVVALGDRLLGKPSDAADAEAMLLALRGRTHHVWTAVWLARSDDPRTAGGVERTAVRFHEYDRQAIRRYVETGEPLDKAGAYAIQGGGAEFAAQVDGSWSNVVGLPLERLPAWLAELDLTLAALGCGPDTTSR